MFKNLKKREEGFTIIEVLIVLAIAGLIMLIVFLAVPALQRNSRNNARNNEAARIGGLVTECLANRNGQTGSCDSAAEINYTAADFGQLSAIAFATGGTAPSSGLNQAGVWYGRTCTSDGAGPTATGASSRSVAILFTIEPNITRCVTG